MSQRVRRLLPLTALLTVTAWATVADADHAWGSYHWKKPNAVLTLAVGDNLTTTWDTHFQDALDDWNLSAVLDLQYATGGAKPRNCRPTAGRIEVCNATYGNTGWLGVAQIWASGSHITQAVAKMNDTYFNSSPYNAPEWRQLVMCQEVAHDFGLDHQDEEFDNPNLGSCMDYTSNPLGPPSNLQPNAHDYEQIAAIYSHTDAAASSGGGPNGAAADLDLESPGQWGRLLRSNRGGRVQIFERDLGRGQKVITHVFWADPDADRPR